MAEEISEETTDKLQTPDNQHIDLESIPVIIHRILNRVVKSVVAGLGKRQDNKRQ